MHQINKLKLNKFMLGITFLSVSLAACNSGGSSSTDSGGGGNGNLNIQSVATISSLLDPTYSPSCLYEYGNIVSMVNGDGSGTGYNLNLASGQASQVSGLPNINLANGDQCLANYQELSWINSSNPYVVNIFNPDKKQTQSADLSNAGIAGSDIAKSSFDISGSGTGLYSNNNFLHDGSFGFSVFNLPNPTTHSQLDNQLYFNRDIARVLYGFDGAGGQFFQLLPTNTQLNQPAGIAYIQLGGGGNLPDQHVSPITDTHNQLISAMSTAWDFTPGGRGVIITTGAVQPVIYSCPLVAAYSYQCNKTYTGSELTTKYRIMRLLGSNNSYLYFMGMDLAKADIEIFSIQL